VVLVGPSGCGKDDLADDAGSRRSATVIAVDGEVVNDAERPRHGHGVPGYALTRMTVYENMSFAAAQALS
jgi:ABC-type sugar transport system ATPase subunit